MPRRSHCELKSAIARLSWIISMLSLYGVVITISVLHVSFDEYERFRIDNQNPTVVCMYARNEWLSGKIQSYEVCGTETIKICIRGWIPIECAKTVVNNLRRKIFRYYKSWKLSLSHLQSEWNLYFRQRCAYFIYWSFIHIFTKRIPDIFISQWNSQSVWNSLCKVHELVQASFFCRVLFNAIVICINGINFNLPGEERTFRAINHFFFWSK